MTALNVFVHHDRVELITDAAVGDADGRFLWRMSKQIVLQEIKAVAASSGGLMFAYAARQQLERQWESFDDLVDELPALVRAAKPPYMEDRAGQVGDGVTVIAGWSERDQEVQAWASHTFPQWADIPGFKPAFTPWRLGGLGPSCAWRSPFDPPVEQAVKASGLRFDASKACARKEGLELVQIQRRVSKGPLGALVGGYAELATVTSAGVTQERLANWSQDVDVPADHRRFLTDRLVAQLRAWAEEAA